MTSASNPSEPFGYCMNTSTLSKSFDLTLVEQIDVIADAGFTGIEPWVRQIEAHLDAGGTLDELRQRIDDAGLEVSDIIAFFKWCDADKAVRRDALEDAKRQMDLVAQIGATRIAAPPFGDVANVGLDEIAECFCALDEVGKQTGVKPILEFWGHAPQLSRLCDAAYVAAATGLRDVQMLVDVYHIYKGGSSHASVALLNGAAIGIVHMNDYPAEPVREVMGDADRVMPGDGVAPMDPFLQDLHAAGYRGMLSLELFCPDYGGRAPADVAAEGFAKTRQAVVSALGG